MGWAVRPDAQIVKEKIEEIRLNKMLNFLCFTEHHQRKSKMVHGLGEIFAN